MAEASVRGMKVGLMVTDLETGRTLFEHDADEAFNPASVTKVITTATALHGLGPGFTFKTRVLREGLLNDGVLRGNLVIQGEGDPSITLERLWRLASLIRLAGVRSIEGDLVLDDRYFDAVRQGRGYDDFDESRAYTAPVGALSATWNTIAVVVRPGEQSGQPLEVALDPPTRFVTVENRTKTTAGGRRRVSVTIDGRTLRVTGSMPRHHGEKVYYRPIDDPPLYFGTLLQEFLAKEGITLRGSVRMEASSPAEAASRPEAPFRAELFEYESEPLGVIVRGLNKLSNNFTAEQLLKALGAERYGAPGTSEKGLKAVSEYLVELGIAPDSWTMRNGSGLARDNELSPRLFVKVLEAAHRDFKVRGDFVASMGISGEDGTLAHRMVGLPGEKSVRGKTGTVDGSTCLAGYAQAANGHLLSFAILMNGVEGQTRRAMTMQDKIGSALAAWRGPVTDSATADASHPSGPEAALKKEMEVP